MKFYYFIIFETIFLGSCVRFNHENKKEENITDASHRNVISNNKGYSTKCKTMVINNDIIKNLFSTGTFLADTSDIKRIFKKTPILLIDTLKGYDESKTVFLTYKHQDSELTYLRNDNGYYLIGAEINDNDIILNPNCRIGMNIDSLLKKTGLSQTLKCDTLVVRNEDQTYEYMFVFNKQNNLKTIFISSED